MNIWLARRCVFEKLVLGHALMCITRTLVYRTRCAAFEFDEKAETVIIKCGLTFWRFPNATHNATRFQHALSFQYVTFWLRVGCVG